MTSHTLKRVVVFVAASLAAPVGAGAVVVHEFQFDFTIDGAHAVTTDSQPFAQFTGLALPGSLAGTFDLLIAPVGGNLNISVNAGIGVEGAPDANRIGNDGTNAESMVFQIGNITDPDAVGLRYLVAGFSDPAATALTNHLVTGETALLTTSDGQSHQIMGADGVFTYPIPQPATGAAITIGPEVGSNFQISGLRIGFVDQSVPTAQGVPLELTFGNDDVSSPGVEAVIFGMGNTGSTDLTQTIMLPDELGGTIDLRVQTTNGNLNVDATGLGVQGAPDAQRIGVDELVALTFENLNSAADIIGIRVLTMRSDAGGGTDALLAENELAAFFTDAENGLIEGTNNRAAYLPLTDQGVLLGLGETITFSLDAASGAPGTGAVGFRLAGLQLDFVVADEVPEPASALLLGLAGAALLRRRRHVA